MGPADGVDFHGPDDANVAAEAVVGKKQKMLHIELLKSPGCATCTNAEEKIRRMLDWVGETYPNAQIEEIDLVKHPKAAAKYGLFGGPAIAVEESRESWSYGLFSFAPTGFGRRLFLRRSPVLFQNPHALTIGADRDMTAFGWGRRRFHLLIERLDILGQGQALTLRQIREKGKIENLIEAINGAAKILLRTRRV